MSLRDRLEGGLREAMKSGDRVAVSTLRLSLSELKNAQIEKRRPLDDGEVVQVLRSGVKKRNEAAELFRKGSREDLARKEEAEILVLERFLPAALSPEELERLVEEAVAETGAASPRDLGAVMKTVLPKVAGRADGAAVSRVVKRRLSPPA